MAKRLIEVWNETRSFAATLPSGRMLRVTARVQAHWCGEIGLHVVDCAIDDGSEIEEHADGIWRALPQTADGEPMHSHRRIFDNYTRERVHRFNVTVADDFFAAVGPALDGYVAELARAEGLVSGGCFVPGCVEHDTPGAAAAARIEAS